MTRICPSSNLPYKGRCPVTSCAYNFPEGQEETEDCLLQLAEKDDMADRVAARIGLTTRATKRLIEEQSDAVIEAAECFSKIFGDDTFDACPACGYSSVCRDRGLCNQRKQAIEEIVEDVQGTLTKAQAWRLLSKTNVRFSRRRLDEQARALLLPKSDFSTSGKQKLL